MTHLGTRPTTTPPPVVAPHRRFVALDVARALAVTGMMAAHLVPLPPGVLSRVVSGFPSTLFAVLAGASAVLATRRHAGRPVAASVSLVARGTAVAAVGALLGLAPSGVMVVLVYLGVALALGAVLVHLRTSVLAALAVLLTATGPFVTSAVRDARDVQSLGELSWESPADWVTSVLFTGAYPVITWTVYVTTGIVLARTMVAAHRQDAEAGTRAASRTWALRCALGGLVVTAAVAVVDATYRTLVAVPALAEQTGLDQQTVEQVLASPAFGASSGASWDSVLLATAHSGHIADVLLTASAAVAVTGALTLALRHDGAHRALRPLAWLGAVPLTVYVLHVLSTWLWTSTATPTVAGGSAVLAGSVAAAALLGWVLHRAGRRGPLEAAVSAAASLATRGLLRGDPAARGRA